MKLKYCLPAILLLLLQGSLYAQALTIGEACPPVIVTTTNGGTYTVAGKKGTITIICFWTTTCHGSVSIISHLDMLQKQMAGKINVIAVSGEPASIAGAFISKQPQFQQLSIPVVTGDTALNRLFPHTLYPHIAWLDEKNILRYITGGDQLTAANVEAFWQGKQPVLPVKTDVLHYDAGLPLLVNNNGAPDTGFACRSLITEAIPGLSMNAGAVLNGSTGHFYCVNFTLRQLYAFALPQVNAFHASQFVIDSSVSRKYGAGKGTGQPPVFCYDLVAPVPTEEEGLQWMLQDLNRFFHVNGSIQQRELPCYVLVCTGKSTGFIGDGGKEKNGLFEDGPKYMYNLPLGMLARRLQIQTGFLPVVNETGYTGKASLQLPADITDIKALSLALQQYGLDIQPAQRLLPCFILKSIP